MKDKLFKNVAGKESLSKLDWKVHYDLVSLICIQENAKEAHSFRKNTESYEVESVFSLKKDANNSLFYCLSYINRFKDVLTGSSGSAV